MKVSQIIVGVIFSLVVMFLGGAYALWSHNQEIRAKEIARQMDIMDAKDAASRKQYEKEKLIMESCKSAVKQALAPTPVLDWSYRADRDGSPYTNAAGSLDTTATGFRAAVAADIGGQIINVDCYHNETGAILKLVRTS